MDATENIPGNPDIIAIIQARAASSRLPNKVLLEIAGQPMLSHVYRRTKCAQLVNQVVVATTNSPADDAVATLCDEKGYPCYRGSEFDVLDRYYQAAAAFNADIVVRITADCPVIDPDVIDYTINLFLGNHVDYKNKLYAFDFAANRLPPPWNRTYPIGLDTEVCSFEGLMIAWQEADKPHQREHVMPFFYENADRFRILHVTHDPSYGDLRWTVDTPQDLELIRQIYAHFNGQENFSWLDILKLIEKNPQLMEINAQVIHKHYQEIDNRS